MVFWSRYADVSRVTSSIRNTFLHGKAPKQNRSGSKSLLEPVGASLLGTCVFVNRRAMCSTGQTGCGCLGRDGALRPSRYSWRCIFGNTYKQILQNERGRFAASNKTFGAAPIIIRAFCMKCTHQPVSYIPCFQNTVHVNMYFNCNIKISQLCFFFFLWKQNWQTWGLLPLFFLVYSRLLPGRFCGRLHKLLNVTRNQSSAANDDLHTVAVSRSPNDVEKTQVGGL